MILWGIFLWALVGQLMWTAHMVRRKPSWIDEMSIDLIALAVCWGLGPLLFLLPKRYAAHGS